MQSAMPILDRNSLEFLSRSVEQTRRVGMRLGAFLQTGDVICLVGDLGSGKTTLVQGLAVGWGSLDPASSPSFVLVNEYRGPQGSCLYHLDAYRLADAREAEQLDIEAMLLCGPLVVEWADRISAALPAEMLQINLEWISDEQRDLLFMARGDHYQRLLTDVRRQLFGVR